MKELNEWLFVFINSHKHEWLNYVMQLASSIGTFALCIIILSFYAFSYFKSVYFKNPIRLTIVLVISTSILCLLILLPIFYIFPNLINMPPPCLNSKLKDFIQFDTVDCSTNLVRFSYRPFIISYFAMFLFCLFEFRLKKIFLLLILISLIVAYSRVYLGFQYPLNVLLSILLGIIFGFLSSLPHFIFFIIGTEEKKHF
jgi:membrane-associated phospholipid phosphatase